MKSSLFAEEKKRHTKKLLGDKLWGTQATRYYSAIKRNETRDFPGGSADKNPPANAGDTGLIPGPGRSHMRPCSMHGPAQDTGFEVRHSWV